MSTKPDRRSTMKRICRGCGCTDDHACITDDGGCFWVLLDIDHPTGICSACAEEYSWHPGILALIGIDNEAVERILERALAQSSARVAGIIT